MPAYFWDRTLVYSCGDRSALLAGIEDQGPGIGIRNATGLGHEKCTFSPFGKARTDPRGHNFFEDRRAFPKPVHPRILLVS